MATAYIYRTPTSGNRKTWTFSAWVKRGTLGARQGIYNVNGGSNPYNMFEFIATDALKLEDYDGGTDTELITTRLFRDVGAWYHIVVAYDTTQATPADRIKLYVNGVQETDFSTETYCAQDFDTEMNTTVQVDFGREQSNYFDGEMSHVQLVDGLQLAPTEFGEVDSTSGIWKIKTTCYATPGTNGFCMKMEDRTNLDLDSSSNALTFTTSGTLTATYDNPDNNFCTFNPLDNYWQSATFANGNNTVTTHAGNYTWNTATIGLTSGKWYWECKGGTNISQVIVAICSKLSPGSTTEITSDASSISMEMGSGNVLKGSVSQYTGTAYTTSNVCGIAMDLDNNKYYLALDNVWKNSGDPTSGATGTGAVDITTPIPNTGFYFPAQADPSSSVGGECFWNFGNGYFGTTAVTSAEADGDGIGAFEYAPPTGYFALCTKNIKAYGG